MWVGRAAAVDFLTTLRPTGRSSFRPTRHSLTDLPPPRRGSGSGVATARPFSPLREVLGDLAVFQPGCLSHHASWGAWVADMQLQIYCLYQLPVSAPMSCKAWLGPLRLTLLASTYVEYTKRTGPVSSGISDSRALVTDSQVLDQVEMSLARFGHFERINSFTRFLVNLPRT